MAQTPHEIDFTNEYMKLKGIDFKLPGGTEPKPVEASREKPATIPGPIIKVYMPVQATPPVYEYPLYFKIGLFIALLGLFLWFLGMSMH